MSTIIPRRCIIISSSSKSAASETSWLCRRLNYNWHLLIVACKPRPFVAVHWPNALAYFFNRPSIGLFGPVEAQLSLITSRHFGIDDVQFSSNMNRFFPLFWGGLASSRLKFKLFNGLWSEWRLRSTSTSLNENTSCHSRFASTLSSRVLVDPHFHVYIYTPWKAKIHKLVVLRLLP